MSAAEFARKHLEDLLSFFGLNVAVEASEDEARVALNVPSTTLNGFLIGQRGENLYALQHLVTMAARAKGYEEVAVIIDVAGYKQQRDRQLTQEVQTLAQQVISNGQDHTMQPMSSYERRVAHQAVTEIDGVTSESVGDGRDRRVVIKPTNKSTA